MNISVVSCEKQLARMLELELLELHVSVKTITEKLSPPALDIAVNNTDLIIFDTEYYSGDISYIHQTKKPFAGGSQYSCPWRVLSRRHSGVCML